MFVHIVPTDRIRSNLLKKLQEFTQNKKRFMKQNWVEIDISIALQDKKNYYSIIIKFINEGPMDASKAGYRFSIILHK